MRKELFGKNQSTKKLTSTEREKERARKGYESLLKDGHKTEFQLRDIMDGISESTFFKMNRGIFNEEPWNTLLACHNGIWYTPQREHFDVMKDEWVLSKNFVEDTKTVEKTK